MKESSNESHLEDRFNKYARVIWEKVCALTCYQHYQADKNKSEIWYQRNIITPKNTPSVIK